MIEIQRESEGIELRIDLLTEYSQFSNIDAVFKAPSGFITTLPTQKNTHTTASVFINGELEEEGLYELQLIGTTPTGKSYSEVGRINLLKNIKD